MEIVGRVSADSHERSGAQRDLPAIANQDIDPDGSQRKNQEGDENGAEHVLVDQQWNGDEGKQHDTENGPAVLINRKELLIRRVGGLELAVFPVEHLRSPRLHAVDDLFAKQTLRSEQQENQCQLVGEPDLDAAADQRTKIDLG